MFAEKQKPWEKRHNAELITRKDERGWRKVKKGCGIWWQGRNRRKVEETRAIALLFIFRTRGVKKRNTGNAQTKLSVLG